jgi:hypothetical protein
MQNPYEFLIIFDQKAWTIAMVLIVFGSFLHLLNKFQLFFVMQKNMNFWPFLTKKHGL